MRIAKVKQFIGSTVEEIEQAVSTFFGNDLCPGNLINSNLYKHGGVYQYEVWYAEFISDTISTPVDVDALIGFEPTDIGGDDWDFLQTEDLPKPEAIEQKKTGRGLTLMPSLDAISLDDF